MKKLALLAAASLAALGSALAADLPSRKEPPVFVAPPPPPPPLWMGFYGGLNIGGGWSAASVNPNSLALYGSPATGDVYILPGNTSGGTTAGGVVGGGQFGYEWELRETIVAGFESDIQGTSMSSGGNPNWALYPDPRVNGAFLNPMSPWGNAGVALSWFGTVRGRVGYLVMPTLLVYGTGGFAYGGVQSNHSGNSTTLTGWTVGGGAEWMFMPNLSAKLEYLFTDLSGGGGAWVVSTPNVLAWGHLGYNRHPQFNIVRAGVNYHFNGAAAAPVIARY